MRRADVCCSFGASQLKSRSAIRVDVYSLDLLTLACVDLQCSIGGLFLLRVMAADDTLFRPARAVADLLDYQYPVAFQFVMYVTFI